MLCSTLFLSYDFETFFRYCIFGLGTGLYEIPQDLSQNRVVRRGEDGVAEIHRGAHKCEMVEHWLVRVRNFHWSVIYSS